MGCEGAWHQRSFLQADPRLASGAFGRGVAIAGGRVIVSDVQDSSHATGIDGAIGALTNEDHNTGAVYVFGEATAGTCNSAT